MATTTLSSADAILKNVYRGAIVEQLNQETYAIDQFEHTNVNDMGAYIGKQLMFAVHTGRNRQRSAFADGGTLVTPGAQTAAQGTVTIRYFNTGIELTDQVIKQTENNEGAFVKALTYEIDGATQDLRKDINRQVYGTGDGVIANVSGTVTSGAKTSLSVDSTQYIGVGDVLDVHESTSTAASPVVGGTVTVTAVTASGAASGGSAGTAGTITFTSKTFANALTGGWVSLTGSFGIETDGLRNITAATGTLHNIAASTAWKGYDDSSAAYATSGVTEDLFIKLAQNVRQRSNKGGPEVFLTSPGVQRRLANTYTSNKRWNDAKVLDVEGGYSAIMVAAGNKPVPVISDVDAPKSFAFGIRKDSFAWSEVAKPDWLSAPDGKGSILQLKTTGSSGGREAKWQAWFVWYAALVNVARSQNGRLSQLPDDAPVDRV
jgi:hypothetical protein